MSEDPAGAWERAEDAWESYALRRCHSAWTDPSGPDLPEFSDEYRSGWITGHAAALELAEAAALKRHEARRAFWRASEMVSVLPGVYSHSRERGRQVWLEFLEELQELSRKLDG